MNRKTFTPEQIQELSKNKNVAHCGSGSVMYSKAFKAEAIRQYEAGLSAAEIFKNAGIAITVIGKYEPNHLMHQWRRVLRKDPNENTDPLTRLSGNLATLRSQVAYLKAENHFLARIRARKRK